MRKSKKEQKRIQNSSLPPILYKYVHPDRMEIIENQNIRFTQPHFLNDPFEVRPIFRNILSKNEVDKTIDVEIKKALEEEILKNPQLKNDKSLRNIAHIVVEDRMLSVKNDIIKLSSSVYPLLDDSFYKAGQKRIGILSLTEDKNNLLMWSHYADQHRGFVIGFNSNHEFINRRKHKEDPFRHPRRVRYAMARPKLDFKLDSQESDKIFSSIFLTKSAEWGYEREWRVLDDINSAAKTIDHRGESICLFPAPHDSIHEIIIGARATEATKQRIALMVRALHSLQHVKLYTANISRESFGLTFRLVRTKASIEEMAADLFEVESTMAVKSVLDQYSSLLEGDMSWPII